MLRNYSDLYDYDNKGKYIICPMCYNGGYCPFAIIGYRLPCIFLRRYGYYFLKSTGEKVQRFMCAKTGATFTSSTNDINRHHLRSGNFTKVEDVYNDYLKHYTLGDIADKYNLTISQVRTRIKRCKNLVNNERLNHR